MATRLVAISALALLLTAAATAAAPQFSAEIYSVRPDGSEHAVVWHLDGPVSLLVRSLDGQKIAFSRGSNHDDLTVTDLGGKEAVAIHPAGYPVFSPDGTRLGLGVPCFVNSDGSHPTCYRGLSVQGPLVWSPDGTRIAFTQARPVRIAVVTARGRHVRHLPTLGASPVALAWSPDGKRLSYSRRLSDVTQIYVRTTGRRGGDRRVASEDFAGSCCWAVRWLDGRITYGVIR